MNDLLSNDEKLKKFLQEEYVGEERSWADIADELGTYANKLRRKALKLGIQSRSKSKAQKIALSSGRRKHPTEGKERSEATKLKISEGVAKSWEELSEEEFEERRKKSKEQWDNMSLAEKQALFEAAAEAVRKASKEGSKLEKYLQECLLGSEFDIEYHKERFVANKRLQMDIFLPGLKTVIEVDGPAHFYPIWGQESLDRHLRADAEKSGLLLSNGYCVIRIKHLTKSLSQKQQRDLWTKLEKTLKAIKRQFPTRDKRFIELEV